MKSKEHAKRIRSHISPSLKDNRFVTWALRVGKSANRLSGLVLKSDEHIVQACVADG